MLQAEPRQRCRTRQPAVFPSIPGPARVVQQLVLAPHLTARSSRRPGLRWSAGRRGKPRRWAHRRGWCSAGGGGGVVTEWQL